MTKTDSSGKNYVDSEEYEVPDYMSGKNYQDYLLPIVAISGGITQDELERLAYDLKMPGLQSYDESYLDGSDVWATDLSETDASEICRQRIKDLEVAACKHKVYKLSDCSTKQTIRDSCFALLPMFILTYGYKDKRFSNLIDGRSGRVIGSIPVDEGKKLLVNILKTAAVICFMIFMFIILFL